MAGLMDKGAPQPMPAPGEPPQGMTPPAGGEQPQQGNADKVQGMLILQPTRMLYEPKQAQHIMLAASKGDPARVISGAAIAAVTGSAKAGMSSGAQIQPEQIGNAVVEVIHALGAMLVVGKIVSPQEAPNVVKAAVENAMQGGQEQAPAGGEQAPQPSGPESVAMGVRG